MTAGVQRQYTGTAGRTENAQVAVYLAYAAPAGCAFIDRALYLPRSWTSDPARCRAAGVPEGTGFAAKPALARAMITGALDAAAWVTADETSDAVKLSSSEWIFPCQAAVFAVAWFGNAVVSS